MLLTSVFFLQPQTPAEHILKVLLALGLLHQFYKIAPYFPFSPLPKAKSETFSLIVANVLLHNKEKDAFIQLIETHQPDIVLTLESDSLWEAKLEESLGQTYPHKVKVPKDNYYGMHLYSRLSFQETEVMYLVEEDYPSIRAKIALQDGRSILFFGIHPPPPSPVKDEERTSKIRDAELMLLGKKIAPLDYPTIVCGDLNDVSWSRTTRLFKKMSRLIDARVGHGFYCTFHADYLVFRAPIDHLFHSKELIVPVMKKLPKYGSDHFAMYYEVGFAKANGSPLEKPNRAEKTEIEALIEKV